MLHRFRRAMVRSGRPQPGGPGRARHHGTPRAGPTRPAGRRRAVAAIALEDRGETPGRVRMQRLPSPAAGGLAAFAGRVVEPGTLIRAVRLDAWWPLAELGFMTERAPGPDPPAGGRAGPGRLAARHPPGRDLAGPARLVPGRVHLPLQPPHLDPPRPALLPPPGGVGGHPPRALPPGRRQLAAPPIPSAPPKWSEADIWQLDDQGKRSEHTFDSNICSTRRHAEVHAKGKPWTGPPCAAGSGRWTAPPASRRPLPLDRGQVRFRTLLFRYLAVGFILLATVVVANPGAPDAAADPDPWDYQREQVDVQGRGVLNAYARTTVRATAWLAKSSIERQRDMLRLSLFDVLVGRRGGRVARRLPRPQRRPARGRHQGRAARPDRLGRGPPPGLAQPGRGGPAAGGGDRGA